MNKKDYQEAVLREATRYNDYYTAIVRDVTSVYDKTYGVSHD